MILKQPLQLVLLLFLEPIHFEVGVGMESFNDLLPNYMESLYFVKVLTAHILALKQLGLVHENKPLSACLFLDLLDALNHELRS